MVKVRRAGSVIALDPESFQDVEKRTGSFRGCWKLSDDWSIVGVRLGTSNTSLVLNDTDLSPGAWPITQEAKPTSLPQSNLP